MNEKVGNVILNLDYYSGEDLYSDGSVENDLLEIVKSYPETEYGRIISEKASWPILYHLSPMRTNLIEWIEFGKRDSILEVGAGCGAVTGMLAEKVPEGKVTCIELSKRRSLINATRHKDHDNIEIIVGNFEDIEKALPKFDVIMLIGVLEYAKSYIHSEKPFLDFLQRILQHLTPNGLLIIAIENKIGMKYWAGCREDHTGKFFDSMESYPNSNNVQTFSKKELSDLLKESGYSNVKFYYPYPDYKLPTAIYSDFRLPERGSLYRNIRNFDQDRLRLFDESKAWNTIIDSGLFPEFSNSFLVIAQGAESDERNSVF